MSQKAAGISQSGLPIFNQDWWIKIARGASKYRELKVLHGDVVVGKLPFVLSRSWLGLFRGQDPHWSHLGGPIVDDRLSRAEQAEVIRTLIAQLPRWLSFYFVCNPELSYADVVRRAFQNSGFQHATQMNYVHLPSDGDVLNTRKSKHRGHIKRAANDLECVELSAKEFVQFFEMNLKARGKKSYSPLDVMTSLIDEAVSRGRARAIAAKSKFLNQPGDQGSSAPYHAAIVYVWDNQRCYYWLSTYLIPTAHNSHARPHPDATKLLLVKAMEDARAKNLIFDADGVATPGADNLYRHILGLRLEQRRDIFERATMFERFRQKYRQLFRQLASKWKTPSIFNIT